MDRAARSGQDRPDADKVPTVADYITYRLFVGTDWAGNRPIFTTGPGTPIEPRIFNRRWDSRIKAAGFLASPSTALAVPVDHC